MTRWMVQVRGRDLALPTVLHATANVLRAPGLATDICRDKSLCNGAVSLLIGSRLALSGPLAITGDPPLTDCMN